jgi:DNA polymerase-1
MRFTYKLTNYLIQGTAADILKAALAKLWQTDVGQYMRLTVHDEVVFDVPEEYVEDAHRTAAAAMAETEMFAVPLTADCDIVQRWGDHYR